MWDDDGPNQGEIKKNGKIVDRFRVSFAGESTRLPDVLGVVTEKINK